MLTVLSNAVFFSRASLTFLFVLVFFLCTLKVCKPGHRQDKSGSEPLLSFQSAFVSGHLSPQIEGDMLQYVIFFILIFISSFFLEKTLKKDVYCKVFPSAVNMTMLSFV